MTRSTRPLGVPGAMRTLTGSPDERRHLDRGAQRRLGEGDGQVDGEVVAVAGEDGVRLDAHGEHEVARRPPAVARGALAAQPDLLAVA